MLNFDELISVEVAALLLLVQDDRVRAGGWMTGAEPERLTTSAACLTAGQTKHVLLYKHRRRSTLFMT